MQNTPTLPEGQTLFVNAGIAAAVLVTAAKRKRTMRFHHAPDALAWCINTAPTWFTSVNHPPP